MNYFEPDDQFKWSYKERKINKSDKVIAEKHYLNKTHLEKHKWLKHSMAKQ